VATDRGPLELIDDGTFPYLSLARPFVDLTHNHIADTYPHHAALESAHQSLAEASDPTPFDNETGASLGDADYAHAAHGGGFAAADPVDVIAASGAQSDAVEGHRDEYNDPPPPEIPPGVQPPPPSGPPPPEGRD